MEAVLYILSGITVYAGVHHLYLRAGDSSTRPHVQLGLMYFLLAAFAYGSALTYHVQDITALISAGKLSVSMGILLWGALIWYVAFHIRFKPMLVLDALTAVWLIFLIKNVTSPHSLLYSDIAQVEQTLPSGETVSLVHSSVSPWWTAMEAAILASLLFCLYAAYRLYKTDISSRLPALTLGGGLMLLALVTLSDHLLINGVFDGVYLAPFGFLGFLLSNSLYPAVQTFYAKHTGREAPVIYNLTYNSEQASFHNDVSELKTPSSDGLKIEVPLSYGSALDQNTKYDLSSIKEEDAKAPVTQAAITPETETERAVPQQEKETAKTDTERQPLLDQTALHTISDNLIDIAVYATMAMNRFKRGDADPQVLEDLCKKVRSKSIKTRRLVNQYTETAGQSGNKTD